MGFCCVPGCSSSTKIRKNQPNTGEISFYSIPKRPPNRYRAFIVAIRREDKWKPSQRTTICSLHFAKGRKSEDPAQENWVPTVNLLKARLKATICARKAPKERSTSALSPKKRQKYDKENLNSLGVGLLDDSADLAENSSPILRDIMNSENLLVNESDVTGSGSQSGIQLFEEAVGPHDSSSLSTNNPHVLSSLKQRDHVQVEEPQLSTKQVQEQNFSDEHSYSTGTLCDKNRKIERLEAMLQEQSNKIKSLQNRATQAEDELKDLKDKKLTVDKIKDDPNAIQFYTGFPNYESFMAFFKVLEPKVHKLKYWRGPSMCTEDSPYQKTHQSKPGPKRQLTPLEEMFMVLVRLRVGLYTHDIADRFGIDESHVSRIFTTWIHFLYFELKEMFPFPDQDTIRYNMPKEFARYPTTRVIIDCTEVFVETPSSLNLQSATWSNYKHHNTWKILVGITPNGSVSFVSDLYGGRVSDKAITQESEILDMLDEGDNLMADRGFDIDNIMPDGTALNIPAFKGSKAQLPSKDTEETMQIASVRIHVERAIGRIKNYHILDGVMPISLSKVTKQIFTVCAYLTNFMRPLLPPGWTSCVEK